MGQYESWGCLIYNMNVMRIELWSRARLPGERSGLPGSGYNDPLAPQPLCRGVPRGSALNAIPSSGVAAHPVRLKEVEAAIRKFAKTKEQ